MKQGELSATLAATGTAVRVVHPSRCPDIGPICAVRDEPPQFHDQMFYVGELRAVLDYRWLSWLSTELQLPFRVTHTTVKYLTEDGRTFTPDYENIHHRNETLAGLGDAWVSARGTWSVFGLLLTGRLGLTLPLGRTEDNPFALGEAGLTHQHVQFGTGTFNPLLGLELQRDFGPVRGRAYSQAQVSFAANARGYQAGTRVLSGLDVSGAPLDWLRLHGTFDVFHEEPERWGGVIQQDGNLGRTDLLLGVALDFTVKGFFISPGIKVPVYQHFAVASHEGGQLTYPLIFNLSVQRIFDTGARAQPAAAPDLP